MAVALKARIVSGDERESGSGERTKLNLGHTLGHAIEAAHGFTGVRHGEAVALGMAAAFRVSMRLSVASTAHAERALALLGAFGLDTDVEPHLGAETLALVGADKKRTSGKVRFVVPGAPGDVRLVELETDRLAGLLRS